MRMHAQEPKRIVPVTPFLGLLFNAFHPVDDVLRRVMQRFGPLVAQSRTYDFEYSSYYAEEMGPELHRIFCALPGLVPADRLLDVRTRARKLEAELSVEGRRTVNIDPGYLDAFKVVLLSDKYSGRKVYLGQGCYADVTMTFEDGTWRPGDRAFPDFRDGRYTPWFTELRKRHMEELRKNVQTQP